MIFFECINSLMVEVLSDFSGSLHFMSFQKGTQTFVLKICEKNYSYFLFL
jgi:hypothetical protein